MPNRIIRLPWTTGFLCMDCIRSVKRLPFSDLIASAPVPRNPFRGKITDKPPDYDENDLPF